MVTYPKDWKEETLANIASFKNGQAHENSISIDGKHIVVNSKFISTNGAVKKRSNMRYQPANSTDILMVMSDLPNGKALGKCYYVEQDNVYTVNQRICIIGNASINSKLLYYLTNRNSYFLEFDNGVTQTNLRREDILNCLIRFPDSQYEQESIAETLSCMDDHIANLTELIEKKKAIRYGALEDLVSGRTRLKGFSDEWEEHSFNDFLKIKRGASPRPIEYYVTQNANGVNWIKIGDAPKYGKHIVATKEKITESGAMQSVRVYPRDFLLSNSMSFGRPYILSIEGCIHDGWLRLFDFQDTADDEYLYYLLSSDSVQRQYQSYAAGSGVQNLNKEVVKKVVVHLPSLPEQKAIAKTLSCIDTEIASLEEEKDKMLQIKAGAMDDLLTGRVRLM